MKRIEIVGEICKEKHDYKKEIYTQRNRLRYCDKTHRDMRVTLSRREIN